VRLFLKQLRNRLRTFGQTIKQTTMKKLMIFVGALTLTGSLFAQKPASDDARYSLEGLANLNTSNGMNFAAPSIRLRYFATDKIAARLQFDFGGDGSAEATLPSSESYTYYADPFENTGSSGTLDVKRSQWNLGLGAEYHFTGTDKMSPYVTAGFLFGKASYQENWNNVVGDAIIEGGDPMSFFHDSTVNYQITAGNRTIGFNLGAGFDYYIKQNLYLGLEFNLTNKSVKNEDIYFTDFDDSENNGSMQNGYTQKFSNIGAVQGSVRIGWRF
jgi:opacity protein-like surface antigen